VADEPASAPAGSRTEPAERGTLTIKDKVVERLAVKAALDTDGVLARSEGFGKLTGRDLPRVRVLISGGRVRAGVDIAALWPTPLPALTASVRDNVARALSSLAGLHVDGVDVTVPAIIVDPTPAGVTSGGSAIT
jgi:uncharacterized alkaline shock family protein YloU